VEEIKAYIESGILELYVIGDLAPQEQSEVEMMAMKHPEIKAELAQIQSALEGYADAYAVSPAEHLRDRILNNLIPTTNIKSNTMDSNNTVSTAEKEEPKIINADRPKGMGSSPSPSQPSSFYKYAFAACLALLLMSVASSFVLYNRLKTSNQQLAALQDSNKLYINQVAYINSQLSESQTAVNALRNPDVKLIKLKGTKMAPTASMMMAFNPKTQEVLVDMSSFDMPSSGKGQYQLWGMVNGKPINLGLFVVKRGSTDTGMKKMAPIGEEVEAFAVTLEPMGGSQIPTMAEMMVMSPI